MRECLPWLCQGDVFELLPQVVVSVDATRRLKVEQEAGASLLITHDCDLDKPTGNKAAPRPRIERLQFIPLRDVAGLDPHRQSLVRSGELNPPEPIYAGGPVPGVGKDAYGSLTEIYYLPAAYFGLRLEQFNHPDAEPGGRHLTGTDHQNRVGRIDEDHLRLLRLKMAAYWPRFDAR